uniref:Fe2OG dioxygenase domain-containing protein n=1 Tax=Bionectria ochroleuca TaxID=29856 RepID=A0A8H7NME1_BIOOC
MNLYKIMAMSLRRPQVLSLIKAACGRSVCTTAAAAQKIPPGFVASVGRFKTFVLPEKVDGSPSNHALGKAMVEAWRRDGILQVAMSGQQQQVYWEAQRISRRFFRRPYQQKAACVDAQSYAGYIASGEEITDGIPDYSEIFTVTKDLPLDDQRVMNGWPCHGPCPWPDSDMANVIQRYMDDLAANGERMLQLIEFGLHVPPQSLTKYTGDGWHHLRMLRFPPCNRTNGRGKEGRGIGSHTDYGLLIIAAQDDVGGLFIRPPSQGERYANWEKSSAGLLEDESGWVFVPPVPGVFTVFPGDMMQYMTNSVLSATPHKVGLNTRERFAFAYFHEPDFRAVVRPLQGYNRAQPPVDGIHYGTHFTNMFWRNYPDRLTTRRLEEEGRYRLLGTNDLRVDM